MLPTALFLLACTSTKLDTSDSAGIDADGDRWLAWEDCNDENAQVNPGMTELPYDGLDNDCDSSTPDDDLDGDGHASASDCDDDDPAVHPDAEELCDGVDQDCDGLTDEDAVDGQAVFDDADGDGYGDEDSEAQACEAGSGQVTEGGDCDDVDAAVHPGAKEICNGADDDCDGLADEGLKTESGWADADGDGYGDPDSPVEACDQGSGVADNDQDCDDGDASVFPDALERQDGVDNDCDGLTDEAVVLIVVGYQCQEYASSFWPDEVGAVYQYLSDLGLGWDEIDEDGSTGDDEAYVGSYPLALFCKCGWAWESHNQDMVHAFLDARGRGTATFLFDDDIAFRQYEVTDSEGLVFLADASDNGTQPSTATIDASSKHPAYLGPYGTPTGFEYNWDMDRTSTIGVGEVVLGSHSGGYPMWLVWEDSASGVRASTLVAGLHSANEGHIGGDAEAQIEIIFKNTVSWLLDM